MERILLNVISGKKTGEQILLRANFLRRKLEEACFGGKNTFGSKLFWGKFWNKMFGRFFASKIFFLEKNILGSKNFGEENYGEQNLGIKFFRIEQTLILD